MPSAEFTDSLLTWWDREGRHDPPWRDPERSPFELLLAEVLAHVHDADVCAVVSNVERVLSRCFDVDPDDANLGDLADDLVPPGRGSDVLHALIDLGASVCTPTAPDCSACPLATECASATAE